MEFKLTNEEKKAIKALKRLEKIWPETIWLYSNGAHLYVMRKNEEGKRVILPTYHGDGGVDPEYVVGTIYIESDGGDW